MVVPKDNDKDDMSMQEILASIRKYVTDEAKVPSDSTGKLTRPETVPVELYEEDDIIELTTPVKDFMGENTCSYSPYTMAPLQSSRLRSASWEKGRTLTSSTSKPTNPSSSHSQAIPGSEHRTALFTSNRPSSRNLYKADQSSQIDASGPLEGEENLPNLEKTSSFLFEKSINPKDDASGDTPTSEILFSASGLTSNPTSTHSSIEDSSVDELREMKDSESKVERPAHSTTIAETLISQQAAYSSSQAFSRLYDVSKQEFSQQPTIAKTNQNSLEQAVLELLRPLLKNWLDQNLPHLVETLVAKEIETITKNPSSS